jgi:NAD+ kinase
MDTKSKVPKAARKRPALALVRNDTLRATPGAVKKLVSVAKRLGIELLEERDAKKADALLALGGDGSMLSAVRAHAQLGKPFLGVNIGTLGYLSAAPLSGAEEALRAWRDGETRIEERSMLRAQVRRGGNGPAGKPALALNDLVATRQGTGRVACIALEVDGEHVAEFPCDGLILATPTGSTAYSLSAGGPLLSPRADAFVANVICPHTLTSRPLVLPGDSIATVRVVRAGGPVAFCADGIVCGRMREGDSFTATTAAMRVSLVSMPGADPFEPLRGKRGWNYSSARPVRATGPSSGTADRT